MTPTEALLTILGLAHAGEVEPYYLTRTGVFFEGTSGRWGAGNVNRLVAALNALGVPHRHDAANAVVLIGDAQYVPPDEGPEHV